MQNNLSKGILVPKLQTMVNTKEKIGKKKKQNTVWWRTNSFYKQQRWCGTRSSCRVIFIVFHPPPSSPPLCISIVPPPPPPIDGKIVQSWPGINLSVVPEAFMSDTGGAFWKACFSPHLLQRSEKVIAANAKLTPCYDCLSAALYDPPPSYFLSFSLSFFEVCQNAAECRSEDDGGGGVEEGKLF